MTRSLAELRQYLALELLFDNDFKDTSGNGNDAVPVDIEWASTRRGLKPRFNGSSSVINCGNDASLNTSDELTLSTHVKFKSVTGEQSIVDKGFLTSYQLETDGTEIKAKFNLNGSTEFLSTSGASIIGGVWYHIILVLKSGRQEIYIDGVLQGGGKTLIGAIGIDSNTIHIGDRHGALFSNVTISDVVIFATGFTAAEELALYNATSGEYGPRIAEISYQHDPLAAIPEQPGTVLRIGGKLSGDAVDTISDRSGEGNDATIFGAMPADDHYFIGGRRFDGDDDYLDCGFDSSLDLGNNIFIDVLFSLDSLTVGEVVVLRKSNVYALDLLPSTNKIRFLVKTDDIDGWTAANDYDYTFVTGVQYNISGCFDGENVEVFVNGVSLGTRVVTGNVPINGEHVFIGGLVSTLKMQGNIKYGTVGELFDASRFNALALLPIFELNFRDYPDNPDAVWLDNTLIPFSSGVVGSNGTFSVDGDQLICGEDTSTCTFRNNFKFDGQEYVTVTIDGIEYSGTGTITQGSVTVSIAQGSNKITIAADNGDVIDKVRITFRDMV